MTQRVAKCIDFTGLFSDAECYEGFCDDVVKSLRQQSLDGEQPFLLVVDRGYNLGDRFAVLVLDHINLTGGSPLIGPNDPVGPRFPVINNVYFVPSSSSLKQGVVAGLKPGIEPTIAEIALLEDLGAQFWSHNTVQTMLVAAHAGWKVLSFLVAIDSEEEKRLTKDLIWSFFRREQLIQEFVIMMDGAKRRSANVSSS